MTQKVLSNQPAK